MSDIGLDEAGNRILLDQIVPTTKSGNPIHSVHGRFGNRPGAKEDTKTIAQKAVGSRGTAGATSEELARRLDAVREAAREFEQWNAQDAAEWLKGRINRPFSQQDIDAFLADVRAQQVSDLVDILDQNERGTKRGRRFVRVQAPRGYTRKAVSALNDNELASLVTRLKARGWDDKQISTISKKLPEARKGVMDSMKDGDDQPFYYSEDDPSVPDIRVEVAAPEVHVAAPATPRSTKKIVNRDPKTGLIISIEDV